MKRLKLQGKRIRLLDDQGEKRGNQVGMGIGQTSNEYNGLC